MAKKVFKNLGESIDLTRFVFPSIIRHYNCYRVRGYSCGCRPSKDLLTYQKSSGRLACKDPSLVYGGIDPTCITDFDNVPTSGIKIKDLIYQTPITGGRDLCYPYYDVSYEAEITAEVEDPRGWTVSVCNALDLIKNGQLVNGELIGSYVYVWVDKCVIILVNYESQLYQDLLNLRNLQSIEVNYTSPTIGQGYVLKSSNDTTVYYLGKYPTYMIVDGPGYLNLARHELTGRPDFEIARFIKLSRDRHVFTDSKKYYIVGRNKIEIDHVSVGNTIPDNLIQKYTTAFQGSMFGSIPTRVGLNSRYVFSEYNKPRRSYIEVASIKRYFKTTHKSKMDRVFFIPSEDDTRIDCVHIGFKGEAFKFGILRLYSDKLMYEKLPARIQVDHPELLKGISINDNSWSFENNPVNIISWDTGNGFNRADYGMSGVHKNVITYEL